MAEERSVALTTRTETRADDTEATKEELQRRMEEARESISQTVTEIKETVVNQYQNVRESITDTLDWREQYRRRPVPFTVGAFGAGLLLGYGVMGAVRGDGEDYDDDEDVFDRIERGFDTMKSTKRSYAASPIIGAQAATAARADLKRPALPEKGATTEGRVRAGEDVGPDTRPSYDEYDEGYDTESYGEGRSAGFADFGAEEEEAEPKGPGLLERFKETKAYDRLQDELATIGERVVEELSHTARSVVVPALLSKLKDFMGIDLSTQREVAQRTKLEHDAVQKQEQAKSAGRQQQQGGSEGEGGQQQDARGAGGSANFATSGGRSS